MACSAVSVILARAGTPFAFVIPAEDRHGQGTCPRGRGRNIEAVRAFESPVPAIPAEAGIHGTCGAMDRFVQLD